MTARVLKTDRRFTVSRAADGCKALHALVPFEAGDVMLHFRPALLLDRPDRHSIQIDATRHALVEPEFLRFTNHSCNPNIVVDTARLEVRALRRISPGDELTYFYPSTEWSMAEPFACACDSPGCLLTIAGAEYLSADAAAGYELGAHIRWLLERRSVSAP